MTNIGWGRGLLGGNVVGEGGQEGGQEEGLQGAMVWVELALGWNLQESISCQGEGNGCSANYYLFNPEWGGSIALNPDALHTFHSFALCWKVLHCVKGNSSCIAFSSTTMHRVEQFPQLFHFSEAQPCTAADTEEMLQSVWNHAIGKSVACSDRSYMRIRCPAVCKLKLGKLACQSVQSRDRRTTCGMMWLQKPASHWCQLLC